ncbi:MAG: helix-turn-helix domain-containing protein [Actinomycetota bacterium]|jgi:HTH-type transcriptional regulator, competence development regulator|nr:helix-turn-helix domain-containing protein [Actinomycetota bacterium]
MTFGEQIKELRKAQGISQRELAEQAEIDFTYLSKIENNRMEPPSESVIQRIAGALGANADKLLVLADKFPSDLADALKDHETISALRRSLEGDFSSFEDFKRALGRRAQPKG